MAITVEQKEDLCSIPIVGHYICWIYFAPPHKSLLPTLPTLYNYGKTRLAKSVWLTTLTWSCTTLVSQLYYCICRVYGYKEHLSLGIDSTEAANSITTELSTVNMFLKMSSCSLLFLCIFISEISIHCCNTIAIRGKEWFCRLFKTFLDDISPFCGATDTSVLNFSWRLLWVSKIEWAALFTLDFVDFVKIGSIQIARVQVISMHVSI